MLFHYRRSVRMNDDTMYESMKSLINGVAKAQFKEEAIEIDEEARVGYKRAGFELIAAQLPKTKEWEITLNNKVRIANNILGVYPTKEKAKEMMKFLLTAYNFGFIEGIEKGQKFGTQDYPDGIGFAIGFQKTDE